jgi:hypothetical protein
MIDAILTNSERQQAIEAELPRAQALADAEAAAIAKHGDGGQWAGKMRKLEDLRAELRDLELQAKADTLDAAAEEMRRLDADIQRAQASLQSAEQALQRQKESPLIQKWLAAPQAFRKNGWGVSFDRWRPWYTSGKPVSHGPQSEILFLRNLPVGHECRFQESGAEREVICTFARVTSERDRQNVIIGALRDRRRILLTEFPELQN